MILCLYVSDVSATPGRSSWIVESCVCRSNLHEVDDEEKPSLYVFLISPDQQQAWIPNWCRR
jgi:hypothetical protein